jgi:hypothetical protein
LTCNISLDTINKYHRQSNLERFGLMAIGLLVRLLEFVSRCGDHIIRRQRPPDPLQLELADRLDLYGIFDLRQHSRADEDLPWFGLVAEPGGDVRYGPDGRIVEASFKPDGAERGKSVRNPDAEANVVSQVTPPIGKFKFREAEAGCDCQSDLAKFNSRSARNTLLWRPAIHWRPLDVTFKYRIAV